MLCPACHASIPDSSRFCPSCGRALDPSSAETVLAGKPGLADEATRLADDATRVADDATRRANDVTRLAKPDSRGSGPVKATSSSSGWLSSSGSIDHGRFAPGSLLDSRYRMIGLLGRGGMGEVYRADDLRLGQPVALKFLPENLQRDPVRLAQLHNEVRTARQVSHPNVCRVYDAGEAEGHLYLTMEYVDGEDLATSLRRIGRFPEDKALAIARQLCAGLAAAHERGVLHRDLKPANVMLDGAGNVRIMDFSLATAGEVDTVRAGTPVYMAPEQLQGREVTARSDLYALGLVLYELFTGRRAYTANSIADLVAQHESGTITSVTEVVKTLDPAIERAIMRCLEREPARRPASALAVSASLPGGDPLAAALAAGETPSPEMVAAAGGEEAAVSQNLGLVLAGGVIVLLLVLAAVVDRMSVLARVPLEKSRPVLVDRAAELTKSFGYTTPVGDSASGYYYDGRYLRWVQTREGPDKWDQLAAGQPSAVRFWYRSSPNLLVPLDDNSSVNLSDPPPLSPDMLRVDLDPSGRLVEFYAVPSLGSKPLAQAVDWDVLFQAARLDRTKFAETEPKALPRHYADEWKAWTGELPELPGVTFRVDAAGFRGRPTAFTVVGAWAMSGGEAAVPQAPAAVRTIGMLIVAALPIGAALLARRNLRLGRSDRRGAFRTWAFAFGIGVVAYIVGPYHVPGLDEVDRMFATLGAVLFWSGVLYVVYLALEPYVRRTWPVILITWSRLMSGRLRDPLLGRDILVGTLAGLVVSSIEPSIWLSVGFSGAGLPQLTQPALTPLFGWREVVANILNHPFNALINGLVVVLMLQLIRQGMKGLASRLPAVADRVVGSTWAIALVSVALFVIVTKRNSIDPVHPFLDIGGAVLVMTAFLVVTLRFGLVALIVAFFVGELVGNAALTVDPSKVYAGPAWFIMAIVLGLAGVGYWMARGTSATAPGP